MKPKKQGLTLGHIACGMCRYNTGIEKSTVSDATQHTSKIKKENFLDEGISFGKNCGGHKVYLKNIGGHFVYSSVFSDHDTILIVTDPKGENK